MTSPPICLYEILNVHLLKLMGVRDMSRYLLGPSFMLIFPEPLKVFHYRSVRCVWTNGSIYYGQGVKITPPHFGDAGWALQIPFV